MFRKKDKQDAIHQVNIKRGITSHFARTLKCLQQRHLQSDSDEFIYSDDYSNNLCSALEAVFLHGLKDSVTQKVSSYVGLTVTHDQSLLVNFWNVCAKFTHKDVITQVRGLSQINTEIGLCRAWIRIALNDGLIESYLHSMLVDKKTLAYYYHSHSYLRDHEQPGILKNYFTGLMSLCFKLSFNSSVLNTWNNTSLQLAGILDGAHVPGALLNTKVGATSSNSENATSNAAGRRATSAEIYNSRLKESKQQQDGPIVVSKQSLQLPHSSSLPQVHSMFSSIRDVEEIRRISAAQFKGSRRSFTPSEGSSSSHVSCPDPSSFTTAKEGWSKRGESNSSLISPALYPRADQPPSKGASVSRDLEIIEVVTSGLSNVICDDDLMTREENDFEQSQTSMITVVAKSVDDDNNGMDLEQSQTSMITVVAKSVDDDNNGMDSSLPIRRPRSRRVTENEEITLSPKSLSMSMSPSPKPIFQGDSERENIHAVKTVTPSSSSLYQTPASSSSSSFTEINETIQSFKFSHSTKTAMTPTVCDTSSGNSSPPHQTRRRTYDEICATLPPLKLDPAEQDAILRKVLGEIDEVADKERAEKHRTRRQAVLIPKEKTKQFKSIATSSTSSLVDNVGVENTSSDIKQQGPSATIKQTFDQDKQKAIVKPGLISSSSESTNPSRLPGQNDGDSLFDGEHSSSHFDGSLENEREFYRRNNDAILHSAEAAQIEVSSHNDGTNAKGGLQSDDGSLTGQHLTTVNEEQESSSNNADQVISSGSYGNSLGNMMGWSSEIENSMEENTKKKKVRPRVESFASMLKSYAGQYQGISTTLDQVIEGLQSDDDNNGSSGDADTQSNQPSDDAAEDRDSDLGDFEILSPLPSTAQGLQEVDTTRMIYLFRIPREHGLSHQSFTCRGCARPIGIIYGAPRLCEFDGGLYCFECHQNNEICVPSSIVFNWDFSKKKVCMENFSFLQELENQPLYDVDELNPKLESHIPELKSLKAHRKQLRYLKSYLFSCSQKMAEALRQKVWPREHLYDQFSTYSVSDFFQVQSGTLQRFIKDLVKFASKHVYECSLCCQKGFICEICRNGQIIYPFEVETTIRCEKCKSVFHQTCLTEDLPCPKCERWGRRTSKGDILEGTNNGRDHPEDYGVSPPGV